MRTCGGTHPGQTWWHLGPQATGSRNCQGTVLGLRGVPITALKGRSWPSSPYTRMLIGVLSGPFQSSTTASSGPPPVLRSTSTCSTSVDWNDQVRRDLPCTFTHVFSIGHTCISGRASLLDFAGFWLFPEVLPVRNGLNAEPSKALVEVLLCCASWCESSMRNLRRAVPGKNNVKRARPHKYIMKIRGEHATRTLPN